MSKEEISVVVCAYNEERLLEDCLQSLINQNYPADAYEIIIVDDASTDRTPDIAKSFVQSIDSEDAHIRYVRIEDGGLSRARNVGIRAAENEVIAFIDGDAVAEPDWLANLAEAFADGVDYVGGRIEVLNRESKIARLAQATRHKQIFEEDVMRNHHIGCNMAYRREVFEEVGGFNDNLISRGDEVSLRDRIPNRFRFQPVPEAVVYHERPERIRDWIKTEWEASLLSGLYRDPDTFIRLAVHYGFALERSLIASLPLTVLLLGVGVEAGLLFAVGGGLAAVRRIVGTGEVRRILKDLVDDYGVVRGMGIHLLYTYGESAIHGIGTLVGAIKYRNDSLLPPNSDPAEVVETQSNTQLPVH
ncbi:glycosyltransferase [Salinibacter ruber]|uniref:glycosyltransferase n=1 Tax=Salinibacter ruber TaxID=146919 RepID=UPI002168CFD9|nr:glycosyltransferase [Salinibacter ruber]MCS4174788.1 glycosyltransferase involved in cell wall biosynthesis [Salinibacter ruber]